MTRSDILVDVFAVKGWIGLGGIADDERTH
jgi:hypothetical protein